MEAVGEREKVVVMVMGKMRDTGRMVVKDSKMGETVKVARKVTFNPAIQTNKQTNKMLTENLQACFSLKGPHPSPVRLS